MFAVVAAKFLRLYRRRRATSALSPKILLRSGAHAGGLLIDAVADQWLVLARSGL